MPPLYKVEVYIDDELKSQTTTDSKVNSHRLNRLNLGSNNLYALTINDKDKKPAFKTIKLFTARKTHS
jgi:hypothetical protein